MEKPVKHVELTKNVLAIQEGIDGTVAHMLQSLADLGSQVTAIKEASLLVRELIPYTSGGVMPENPLATLPPAPEPVTTAESTFRLSQKSEDRLAKLLPSLARVVRRAIQLSLQDFTVFETMRTIEQQRENMRKGTTRTMKSKHLAQADGYAHAVDLVPYIGGKLVWDWDGCYKIACAMDAAATELGVADRIRWGGAWDRVLADYGNNASEYEREVKLYRSRHPGPDFIDGPHFEWV